MPALVTQLTRFGLVGLVGLAVDLGVFNLLLVTVLSPSVVHEGPLVAKVISTSLAIVANWLGNRHWTFRGDRRHHWLREGVEFATVSIAGMAISLLCLWISHYLLEFTSILADNIATNGIGLVLGTAFRFTFYRVWVFKQGPPSETGAMEAGVGGKQHSIPSTGPSPTTGTTIPGLQPSLRRR
jgi:putative flippase GtrA